MTQPKLKYQHMCADADCIPQVLETKFKHLGVFYHEHGTQAFLRLHFVFLNV